MHSFGTSLFRKDRRCLKKVLKFLSDNKTWLCECHDIDTECNNCLLTNIISHSLKVNKKCCRATFINSVLRSEYLKVENLFLGHF